MTTNRFLSPGAVFSITTVAAFAIQVLTWFVLYPLAGYNDLTLNLSLLAMFLLGVVMFIVGRLGWKNIGLSLKDLGTATIAITIAYTVIAIIVLVTNRTGAERELFRSSYTVYAFASNWGLTALGEELVFAGVLFTSLVAAAPSRRKWLFLVIVAVIFALWHLPGYIAIGLKTQIELPRMLLDFLLRALSWCFFGTMYILSGNLWLAALAHASTDYAILPIIVNDPLIGVIFMFILIVLSPLLPKFSHLTEREIATSKEKQ